MIEPLGGNGELLIKIKTPVIARNKEGRVHITAARTKATRSLDRLISFMASRVAPLAASHVYVASTLRTTTMASSTTNPIAKPAKKESVVIPREESKQRKNGRIAHLTKLRTASNED